MNLSSLGILANPWLLLGLIVATLAIGGGGYWRGYSAGEAHCQAAADAARAIATEKTRVAENDLQARIDRLSAEKEKEKHDAKLREDRLRDDLDAGRRRLHVAVDRAALSAAAGAAGGGDGAAIELAPEARRAYRDLRAGIISDTAALEACQAYARAVQMKNEMTIRAMR